ncbi:MAG: purine nucleoside phosphorylase I, inosine and guanosine-specific [Candidatus Cryptobacteroides sp.]
MNIDTAQIVKRIQDCADYLKEKTGGMKPVAGIVLGSGLGKLAETIENPIVIPYKDIPGFPVSTAVGHKGNFIFGKLGGKEVVAMQGRFHYYEGYPMENVTIGVRVMKTLGVEYLFVSNAAGACNQDYKVGDLIIIRDHINLMPNPLIGPNIEEFGERFPDMTCAYDLQIQALAESLCPELGIPVKKGVYLASTGPTYETPAEVRFYHSIGADLLGMSTVPEVIVARHCGLRVFGMSVVTNMSNFLNAEKNYNDGNDVVKQANLASERMTALFTRMIAAL